MEARACGPYGEASWVLLTGRIGMTDNVPVSRTDDPAKHGTGQGAGAVSGATAQGTDRAALGTAFPRTSHLLLLEFGDRKDFDDPSREWRRLFSELLGTFALVLAAAGGGLLHAKGQISLAAAVVAPGLMVTAIILFMGAVSGAHLNPAVSLAFALRGDFPWRRVPGYIVIQLIGATLACLFLRWVFGNVEHLGATLPGPGYHNWQALLMEIVLTALLVSVILGTASAAQNVGAIAALGVGGYIALAGLWAAPVSGVSMNPARSFGPALASGYWTSYWVYLVGPVIGMLIAVGFAFVLRGRGGDVISRAAGSGVLDEGALTAKAELSQDIEQGKVVPPGIASTDTQPSGQ
jgi:aquaporin Z